MIYWISVLTNALAVDWSLDMTKKFSAKAVFKRILSYGTVAIAMFSGFFMHFTKEGFYPIPVLFSARQCLAKEQIFVTVHRDESFRETTYRASRGGCTVEWIARDVELGVIKHRSMCHLSLAEQIPFIKKVYEKFLKKDPNALELRTLFWGRIEPDKTEGLREMAFRLALAAFKSPGWDTRRGKPENKDINGFVKALANQEMIYPELKKLFESFNRDIHFSCAEKVLVQKAGNLPFFNELKIHGVKMEDKLPFDCMAWFSIEKK